MTATIFQIKGTLEVGQTTFDLSDEMDLAFSVCYVSIVYYIGGVPSIPVAGTSSFTGSETGEIYASMFNGVVNANVLDYDRPVANGPLKFIRVESQGIAADSFIATIVRY